MVTLARNEKGLGGGKWERKGKEVLARQLSPAKKEQGESFPLFSFLMSDSLINGKVKISSI